jgi:hypothetical protein
MTRKEGKGVVSIDRPYISYISAEFLHFLKDPGPLNSKKRSLIQSGYMQSCLASHSVADLGCLSRILIFTHPGAKNSNKREG